MRPHLLRLTAFGPFAGTEDVDFDSMSATGPFLLHGDTGAGKTTVLDAVGYALFGKVPGARAGTPLRSHHAPGDVRTSVELWAAVGGRTVHVLRCPEWQRPKKRGGGTTTENASVVVRIGDSLEALRRGEAAVLTRVEEANGELQRLIGMSDQQFFQVVLLPQGDFAAFLRAKDADRAALLQQVFGTERFRDVEDWLAARRQDTARQLEAARGRAHTAAAVVASTAGLTQQDIPAADVVQWAEGLVTDAHESAVLADQALKVEHARHDCAADDLHAATVVVEAQAHRRAAVQEQAALFACAEEMQGQEQELLVAQRAAPVVARLDLADELRAHCQAQEEVAGQALRQAGHDPASPPSVSDLRERVDAAHARCGTVSALRPEQERGLAERRQQAEAVVLAASADAERTAAVAALVDLPEQERTATERLSESVDAQRRLPDLSAEHTALGLTATRARELVTAYEACEAAERVDLDTRGRLRSAQHRFDQVRRRRLDGIAAELAGRLVAGEACEVCGALEHPAPARSTSAGLAPGEEEAAQHDAEAAEALVRGTGDRLAGDRARVGALLEAVAAGVDAPVDVPVDAVSARALSLTLEERAEVSAKALAELQALANDHPAWTERLATVRRRADELARTVQTATGRRDEALRSAAAAQARAEQAEAAVAAGLDGAATLAEAVALAQDRAEVAARAAQAVDGHERATAAAADAEQRARAEAAAAGLASVEEARLAQRDEQWCSSTATRIQNHRSQLHAVEARLADPALAVDLETSVDLDQLREAVAVAKRDFEAASEVSTLARAVADVLERRVTDLGGAETAVEPLREKADRARCLADLVAGGGANTLAMSLSSYVLAARLEEVCEAANTRLRVMTDTRYELVQTDDRAKGARRAGLGLKVRDAWTGQDRAAATLSGGETFLASLALALGLSDVVTAEAGGTRIDAVFVDEGFGSLDVESLDRALDTLESLQANGRMVGLVSHVEGMRQRIPSQLRVDRGMRGSTLTLVASSATG